MAYFKDLDLAGCLTCQVFYTFEPTIPTMLKESPRRHIPFRKLIWPVIGFSALIQLVIISYNFSTGYIRIESPWEFFIRVGYGTLLTTPIGLLIIYPDIFIIRLLNNKFGWNRKVVLRIVAQLVFTVAIAAVLATLLTLLAYAINPYTDELARVITINCMIAAVVNIILMAALEAWFFFRENRQSKQKAEKLEQELSRIRFEVLKSQINPHFLFNSLNVLSSLISQDTRKAQQFIDEFSLIYRYVLETIEKKVVSLSDELEFTRSYIFLQQIRYGENLVFGINLDAGLMDRWLPPLSLQVVLENAIKHNVIGGNQRLHVDIFAENGWLVIRNNLQRKISSGKSTGVGLVNLTSRYELISREKPSFKVEDGYYVVKLPLILSE